MAVLISVVLRRNGRFKSTRRSGIRQPLGSIFAPRNQTANKSNPPDAPDMRDPKNQLDAIGRVSFETTRLLNREEARLLPLLEAATRSTEAGHRVMAQTSMGEILRPSGTSGSKSERAAAFASINSKRLDFAVFDRSGTLVCAVEYQGSGHYQGTAYMRDAVKREVLRRAGVPLLEVPAKYNSAEVKSALIGILNPASQHRHTAVHM